MGNTSWKLSFLWPTCLLFFPKKGKQRSDYFVSVIMKETCANNSKCGKDRKKCLDVEENGNHPKCEHLEILVHFFSTFFLLCTCIHLLKSIHYFLLNITISTAPNKRLPSFKFLPRRSLHPCRGKQTNKYNLERKIPLKYLAFELGSACCSSLRA